MWKYQTKVLSKEKIDVFVRHQSPMVTPMSDDLVTCWMPKSVGHAKVYGAEKNAMFVTSLCADIKIFVTSIFSYKNVYNNILS